MSCEQIIRQGIQEGFMNKLAQEGLFDAMMKETGVGLSGGLIGGAGFGLADQLLDPVQKELNAKKILISALSAGAGGGIGGALGGSVANLLGFPATSWPGLAISRLPIFAGAYLANRATKDGLLESEPVRIGHKLIKKVS